MPINQKNTNNKKSVLNFLNRDVSGRKKFLIISIFVFVVIGVGLIIRSFASTIAAYGSLSCASWQTKYGPCAAVNDSALGNDASKNANANLVNDFNFNAAGLVLSGIPGAPISPTFSTSSVVGNGQSIRTCVKVRPIKNTVLYVDTNFPHTRDSWSLAVSSTYRNYCNRWAKNTSGSSAAGKGTVYINPGSQVRIAYIWVEIGDPSTPQYLIEKLIFPREFTVPEMSVP